MIKVSDYYNLVPELFLVYTNIVKSDVEFSDIDILPLPLPQPNPFAPSSKFTIFIQPEPDITRIFKMSESIVLSRPNCVYAFSSMSKETKKVNSILHLAHLIVTARVNAPISPVQTGQKKFDGNMLLGGYTHHRTMLLNEFRQLGIVNKFLINYHNRSTDNFDVDNSIFYRSIELTELDDPTFVEMAFDGPNLGNTCRPTLKCEPGQHNWISQYIPYNIYNNSYISIVTETESVEECFVITEKLSKPLLLGQPFIVFGCKNFLEKLRDLGFKTFSPWIDERYDLLDYTHDRINAIANSAMKFSSMTDSQKIKAIEEMQSITEHNRQIAMDYSWSMKSINDCIINFSTN